MRVATLIAIVLSSLTIAAGTLRGQDSTHTVYDRWRSFLEVPLVEHVDSATPSADIQSAVQSAAEWFDFVVPAKVFSQARLDLGDLRLIDAQGREVPYALRIRTPDFRDERVPAAQFNESTNSAGAREYSFDLGENPHEHNQLEIELGGSEFRRHALVEGSDDGQAWRTLAERQLLRFHDDDAQRSKDLDVRRIRYAPSRYRYLRLRIDRDPLVDKEPVPVQATHVHYRIEVPGEFSGQSAAIAGREPTRAWNAPASQWILTLPETQQPCTKLRLEVGDAEFARDFQIEVAGPTGSIEPFVLATTGNWQRRAGEGSLFVEAVMPAQQLNRLRLRVIDHSNPPLDLKSAEVIAPVRQIVFARRPDLAGPLRLYFGNRKAELPHYDIERNLPSELRPAPLRLKLDAPLENPVYSPEPLPVTERLPWLIYVVLGMASLAVAAILADVARRAIARHDAADRAAIPVGSP